MNRFKELLTIIMAGGKGERLYPLTRDKAKPSIIFGGIYRIIDFTLSNCLNSGIRRIYVLSQYGSFSLDQHLRVSWDLMRPDLGEYLYSRTSCTCGAGEPRTCSSSPGTTSTRWTTPPCWIFM
jgi:glucose-1-phosphate adenylyltransferase